MKTLYYNGTIITMDEKIPQAEAVLTENSKIIAVGSYSELLSKTDQETKKFDLKKMTLVPGFIDSHSHASKVAKSLFFVDLTPAPTGSINSIADIKEAFRKELKDNPKKYNDRNWLIGNKYDNKDFSNNEKLTKLELDEISTEIPIFVLHFSFHSGVANSKLLELLNINENTIDPNDYDYERISGSKEPNGILKEAALNKHPEIGKMINIFEDQETWSAAWKPVVNYFASQGYTTIQDATLDENNFSFLDYLDQKKELVFDVIGHIAVRDEAIFKVVQEIKEGEDVKSLRNFNAVGVKLFFDGTLELWTAFLSQPYKTQINDNPSDYAGEARISSELAYDVIVWCLKNKKQVIGHCIGDQASEMFISLYEKALAETKINSDIRPVMIHASTVRKDQLARMKKISMMPTFFAEDIYYFTEFFNSTILGEERTANISPTGWAKELDLKFAMHHDCPVFPPNSILTLHTTVNRLTQNGKVSGKHQQVSIEDALKTLTINAAYLYHQEQIRGSITVNKKADFVILDSSPLVVANKDIKDIKIIYTIKNDKVIYANKQTKFSLWYITIK